jgi:hypothetical protein
MMQYAIHDAIPAVNLFPERRDKAKDANSEAENRCKYAGKPALTPISDPRSRITIPIPIRFQSRNIY